MENKTISIKQWNVSDRPREKLVQKGKSALTDAELIAILLGSGNRHQSAVELARHILKSIENNLNQLGRLSISDLKKFNGVGEAKAIAILAALELGRRRKASQALMQPKITSSKDVFEYMSPEIADLENEEFWIILLNRANKIIAKKRISSGGVSGTVADSKIIFKEALDKLASSIILCHNHPSGNSRPSKADIELTKKLRAAGQMLEIPVLDHIIIANQKYFSFADENYL